MFDTLTATQAGSKTRARTPYQQAVDLQRKITEQADEPLTPAALAQLSRAWCDLEERKRILKMRPAPKPIDVTPRNAKRKPTPAAGFTET